MKLMDKKRAMEIVNEHLNEVALRESNTTFAKYPNADARRQVWWLEIAPKNFTEERHVLLANDPGLIWLIIEANSITNPEDVFSIRNNGRAAVEIAVSGSQYMRDTRSREGEYDFRRHIQEEWEA